MSLVEHHVDAQALLVDIIDRVAHQAGVAVAGFVEGLQDRLAVGLVFLLLEFLGLEQVVPLAGVGLLHGLGEFPVGHVVVAEEVDVLDADLVALLDVEVDTDGAADDGVLLDLGVHLAEEEALLLVIPLDDVDGGVLHVVGVFPARAEVQPLLQVLALAALDPGEGPAGDAREFLDDNLEPGGVAARTQRIDHEGDVLEPLLGHQALDDVGHVVARDGQFHASLQAGQLDDLVLPIIMVAFHADAADDIFLRRTVVYLNGAPSGLSIQGRPRHGQCDDAAYPSQLHLKNRLTCKYTSFISLFHTAGRGGRTRPRPPGRPPSGSPAKGCR